NVTPWLAVRPAVAKVAVLFAPSAMIPPDQLPVSPQRYGGLAPFWVQLPLWAAATAGSVPATKRVRKPSLAAGRKRSTRVIGDLPRADGQGGRGAVGTRGGEASAVE